MPQMLVQQKPKTTNTNNKKHIMHTFMVSSRCFLLHSLQLPVHYSLYVPLALTATQEPWEELPLHVLENVLLGVIEHG